MTMRNKIKEFLDTQPDSVTGKPGTSAYRFWKDTNLSRPTAYRLVSDPSYIPTGDVLDKICGAYLIQPGELLVWTPDQDINQDAKGDAVQPRIFQKGGKSAINKASTKGSRIRSFVPADPELAKSA